MPFPRKNHLDPLAIAILLACCILWGAQQVLVKATVAEVAPVFQAFVRFAIALAAIMAWCLWRGGREWVGVAGAFAGVGLAMGDGLFGPANAALPRAWLGDLLGLLAGLLWALTTGVIRTTPLGHVAPAKQLLYQVAVSTAVLPLLSLALGERWSFDFSTFATVSLLVQALLGAFASYLAWMWMLAHYPATKISVFVFLTPVFALLAGAGWLGEPVTPGLLVALTLVAAGIVLVNRKPAAV